MRTRACVISGTKRAEVIERELPPLGAEEVLMRVVSSGLCMSTYKAYALGPEHKRVPHDVEQHPVMTGHEFSGVIEQVGSALQDRYRVGQHIAIQPAMGLPTGESPGYSYPFYGGDATYTIIPKVAVDKGCIVEYDSSYFANGSLAEPFMCLIGAFHANYHTKQFVYEHQMGIRPQGRLALLGCGGPMGIGAIDYALHGPYHPALIVVVDQDGERLRRVSKLFSPEHAAGLGTRLVYVDSSTLDLVTELRRISADGYDDVFVFAAVRELVTSGSRLLATDGCLNFFAGPTDTDFSASVNFYDVHYEQTHYVGTSGGSRDDFLECLTLASAGQINPSLMVSHIGGLNAAPEAIAQMPQHRAGKIMLYPPVEMELTAISDFAAKGDQDPRYRRLADLCAAHNGLWNAEAEASLLREFAAD